MEKNLTMETIKRQNKQSKLNKSSHKSFVHSNKSFLEKNLEENNKK